MQGHDVSNYVCSTYKKNKKTKGLMSGFSPQEVHISCAREVTCIHLKQGRGEGLSSENKKKNETENFSVSDLFEFFVLLF